MPFQCDGDAYCLDSEDAFVVIKSDETSIKFKVGNAPICINQESAPGQVTSTDKCFKFSGKDIYDINSFEYFICGQNPSFASVEDGVAIYMDGVRLGGDFYRYKSGTQSVTQVTQIVRGSVYASDGDCPCLDNSAVKVIIKDKNNSIVYQKTFPAKPDIKVSCNGCPPGYIRCDCDAYPGYCCLPCKETANKINNLAARIRY